MIPLTAKIAGMVVTMSMGFFLSAVAVLCVVPVIQAITERRRPEFPPLPPVMEPGEVHIPKPIEKQVGGATIFVLDVAHFEHV